MYLKFTILLVVSCLVSYCLPAQTSKDATIAVTASFTGSPGSVTLSWPNSAASSLIILRHTKTSPPNLWLSLLNVTGSTQTSLVDNLVSAGQTYEYVLQRTVGGIVSYGYAHVAVDAPVVDNRGKLLFFVDSTLMGPLGNEVGQLKLDMMGDGWTIVPHIVGSGATVQSMKNQIVADYNADPSSVKMVFLLGDLPIPYSGNTNWDGHADHQGAWPADSYYADVNGIWTDATINNTTPGRAANDNVPGDGKFDQSTIPGNVELAVGRVDFHHLSPATFGTSQIELYRRYLNKDHAWRMHEYTVENKVLVDDNFGYFNGEAFAANGYRNGYPLVGAANVVEGDFFQNTNPASYLLGMGCGGGTYTSADGVGNSANFANDTVNVVFSLLFGSYHGDWDYETDPFMPAALASKGGILTCAWAGRPHVFYEGLASGETIGYCTQETQNAAANTGFLPSYGESGAHVSLLGDPTLRANVVAPAKDLVAAAQCTAVALSWTAPAGPAPAGYHVYRAQVRNGTYTRLTEFTTTATTYTDLAPPSDTLYYQVRAVQAVSTPGGGSYLNTSTSATASLIFTPGSAPTLLTTNATITCNQPAVNLVVSSSLPPSGPPAWQGPGGAAYTGATISVDAAGVYTVTVTATNGCTATETAVVSEDTAAPTFSGIGGTLTCASPSVTLSAGNFATGVSWSGPNGFSSSQAHPIVMLPGTYSATVTAAGNGCSSTGTVAVLIDTFLPPLTIPALPTLTCTTLCTNIVLPAIPGYQLSVDGSPLPPGSPLGICQPGEHTISLQSTTNGCLHNYTVTVNQNINPPGASATGGVLACNASLPLQGGSPTSSVTYKWTGPGGFASTQQNPNVSVAGSYNLIVTNPVNGCTSTATALVTNPNAPNVSAAGDTLTCNQPTGMLQGNSTTAGVSYLWNGPNGFTSTQQNPTVTVPGVYILEVTGPNGCTNTTTASVGLDANLPTVTTSGASLNCDHPTAEIQANSSTPNVTYQWSGPNGFSSEAQNPSVSLPGTYVVQVTGSNGCFAQASAVVTQAPPLAFGGNTVSLLSCTYFYIDADVAGGTPPYQYAWSTGDTTESVEIPNGTVTEVNVTVSDAGGCSIVSPTIVVPTVSAIQIGALTVDETGNFQNGSVLLNVTGGNCPSYQYLWSNGATVPEIFNLSAGVYTVTVTCASTGCTATYTTTVHSITVGTEDPQFWKKLSLSPNPAKDEALLEVQFPHATDLQVKVLDATGRLMLILPENTLLEGSLSLDLRRFPPGLYSVLLSTKEGMAVRKLVVAGD